MHRLRACACIYLRLTTRPQLRHAIRASRLALEKNPGRVLRICWETNGCMHPALPKQESEVSLSSGGCTKVDLKAWHEGLHLALCSVSSRRTLQDFRFLADYARRRPSPLFLMASTLFVPGYIDEQQMSAIAGFMASLDPDIPYALLAFYTQFMMGDLPTTSRTHAERCLAAAISRGLKNVRLGGVHFLGSGH